MFLPPVSYTFCSTCSSYMRPWLVFSKTNPLGVHKFLTEALALNLTADYLCLSSLHVPSACFLHLCSTSSSYMRPSLVFFHTFFQLGVHRFLAEALALNLTADYMCVCVVFTCSFCLFLTHLLYLQLVHEALACFFLLFQVYVVVTIQGMSSATSKAR